MTRRKSPPFLASSGPAKRKLPCRAVTAAKARRRSTASGRGDQREIMVSVWAIGSAELRRENFQEAVPCIKEAYDIANRLSLADGLGGIGPTWGQILIAGGKKEQGLDVLRCAAEACRKLGRVQQEDLIRQIKSAD
jgi:hypothetical protein